MKEKKQMKRIIALMLALMMVFAFAACKKAPVENEPETDDIIIETDKPAEEGEEAPAEDAEVDEAPTVDEKPAEEAEKPAEDKKPETKPEVKPETKPEVKPEEKPQEPKPSAKPEEKPAEPAPEVKPEEKPEAKPEASGTAGDVLASVWRANSGKSIEDIANAVISHESIQFMGGTNPIEEGFLSGFDNFEVKGFSKGIMFGPMMGTIPFVGYVFELPAEADVDAFVGDLKKNANPRWNICTEAEQTIVEKSGNKVFFLMCPKSLEG